MTVIVKNPNKRDAIEHKFEIDNSKVEIMLFAKLFTIDGVSFRNNCGYDFSYTSGDARVMKPSKPIVTIYAEEIEPKGGTHEQ